MNMKYKKGQALVEMALVLPILILILAGIIEFGLVLNSYLTIQNASKEGARCGIIGYNDAEIIQVVDSVTQNLNKDDITVNINPSYGIRKSGDTLTVEILYIYRLNIPIISNILGNNIQLKAETSMRVE